MMEREVIGKPEPPPIHPEELKASFEIKFGEKASLQATARATPVGIATVGIALVGILAAVSLVVWASRRRS